MTRNMSEDLTQIIDEMASIIRSNAMPIASYILTMTGLWMLLDHYLWDSMPAALVGAFVDFVFVYAVMASILWSSGYDHPKPPRKLLGLFGLSILLSVAIVIGFVFFVLPGLYLMMKWLPAYGHYLSRDTDITDSMDWSWRSTSRIGGALLLLLTLFFLPIGFWIWLSLIEYWPLALTELTGSFVINFLGSIAYMAITVLGLAALNILDGGDHKPA